MQFTITVSASLLVLASIVAASSVAQVKSDIKAIDAGVVNLYQHCQTDSLNYFNGLAIKHASQELTEKIQTGSNDVRNLNETPSDEDAKMILEMLAKTEGKVKRTTELMIKLKPEFERLGVSGLAASSVNEFKKETLTFSAQLVKIAPESKKAAAKQLANKFNNDLTKCADVYNGEVSTKTEAEADGAAASQSGNKIESEASGKAAGKSRLDSEKTEQQA